MSSRPRTRACTHKPFCKPLRGSGPGQKQAFKDAVALVGGPDRRIDRLCITCCSHSQPSHHTGCPVRSRLRRERGRFFVTLTPDHHRPCHPGEFVRQRDSRVLGWTPRQQRREPRPMSGAVDLGVADHGDCAGREQVVPATSRIGSNAR